MFNRQIRGWLRVAMVACLSLSALHASAAEDESLLLSEGFEAGDTQPADWNKGAAVPGVRYLWPRQAADGKRSLSLKKTANRYFPIAEWRRIVPVTGTPSTLVVTVQVKAQRATKAIVDAQFIDDGGQWLSHEWLVYVGAKNDGDPPTTHDWKEYTGTVAIPPSTKQIAFGLQIYGPGQVWFDQLEARRGATGAATVPAAAPENDTSAAAEAPAAAISVDVQQGATGQYLLVGPKAGVQPPADGFGLVVVLPGGDGSADFHPFVQNIQTSALGDAYLVAQPLAVKWTPQQQIVWPTAKLPAAGAKFTTEQLVAAVVGDVAAKHPLNDKRVYLLAWSSGGPAAYATLLQPDSPAVGGLIAMSVFKPDRLPPLANAKARKFYLLHSPDDRTCPYRMAEAANKSLRDVGARTTLVDYAGGHGWHGDVLGNIRSGIEWLDRQE